MDRSLLMWAMAAAAAVVIGCAEIGRPPGGPIDTTPPTIVAAFPESLAVHVDPSAPVRITFSEKVDKNSVRDWFFIRPYRRIDKIDWDGPVASVRFREALPSDSTISFVVGSGVMDRDGNRIQHPFRRTFSTGESVAPGIVSGTIRRSRIETAGVKTAPVRTTTPSPPGRPGASGPAVYVWLFRALTDSLPDFSRDEPDFLAEVDVDGKFVIDGLPLGVPLLAATVNDGDRSRYYSEARDYLTVQTDTLRLTAVAPAIPEILFDLIDPKAPGQVSGRLAAPSDTSVVDTLSYGVILSEAPEDGEEVSWPPLKVTGLAMVKAGDFTLTRIAPGSYRIAVFVDRDGDGRWTLSDGLGVPLPVHVNPAEETGGIVLPKPDAAAGN